MNTFSTRRLTFAALVLLVPTIGCRPSVPPEPTSNRLAAGERAKLEPQVVAFCGDCHGFPDPATFPASAWHDEVEQGYRFYRESGRTDLQVPAMNDVVRYYRSLAPESLAVVPSQPPGTSPIEFTRRTIPLESESQVPGVASVQWFSKQGNANGLWWCDMRLGEIRSLRHPFEDSASSRRLAQVPHPARVQPTDLDLDQSPDWLVADLGSYQPEDHQRGRVLWLRQDEQGAWTTEILADQLGRVADVRAADFDADGDLDLVVAEFGWLRTGRILLLWQEAPQADGQLRFRTQTLDARHGSIHVPVADLNGDGRPDFVALISQEYEEVIAFVNEGQGKFRQQRLFAAGDPSYGSSGIELVDMDQDGDLDVLYTNGDTMDSHYVKPYHAVHILENQGDYPFAAREIVRLPGVYRALAGDLDRDGDLDVVASAYLPATLLHPQSEYDSLIWVEQTSAGNFRQHTLQSGQRGYMAVELGDFDADGDLDIATGSHEARAASPNTWITLWQNQGTP